MFTVKWVTKCAQGNVTRIMEADDVKIAYKNSNGPPSAPSRHDTVWEVDGRVVETALVILDGPGLAGRSLAEGTVYVMNKEGATVGKYVLSEEAA